MNYELLITQIKNENQRMRSEWLFSEVQKLTHLGEVTYMDMGFEGGYSPVLKDGKLTNYNGKPYKGPAELDSVKDEAGFGTIGFEILGTEEYYQVYHNCDEFFIEGIQGLCQPIGGTAQEALEFIKNM